MAETKISLNLTPDTSLMDDIGAGNLAVHEAIGEIVANSFDARVELDQQLVVNISADNKSVAILDNARGINRDGIERALKLSEKRGAREAHEKGMYGWGLKASSSTIGYVIEITTRPLGEDYELYFKLPIRDLKSGKSSWTDLSAVERPKKKEGLLGTSEHGTAIVISDLRHRGFNPGDLDRHLRFTYAPHLKNGDQILLNGTQLEAWEPVVIDQMRHSVDKTFGKNSEYHIHGWLGVGKTQSAGEYGLNIYRKNQLVEAWNKEAFTSKHQMTSRVVGEIHADFVPTNFNKKGFDKESSEWKELMRLLRAEIAPFLTASRTLGRDKTKDMQLKIREAAADLSKQLERLEGWTVTKRGDWVQDPSGFAEPEEGNPKEEDAGNDPVTDSEPLIKTDLFPYSFQIEGVGLIEISLRVESLGDKDEHWSLVPSPRKILAVLNSDSPLMKKFSGPALEVIQAFATAEAIQEVLITDYGFDRVESRRIRNEYITRALA